MKIYVVTPSYNQLDWLKLCVASVRDQVSTDALNVKRVETPKGSLNEESTSTCNDLNGLNDREAICVHHHIQDACSTDGTVDWLRQYDAEIKGQRSAGPDSNAQSLVPSAYSFSFSSEKDEGMYDAINRGWEKTPEDADIIAHLNCDEQYLPEALLKIAACFSKHRKADVVFADMIVVDGDGEYICHRRPLPPRPVLSRLFIPGFTCTTFQRRTVFFEKGCRFDISWKNLGDVIWYLSLIEKTCRFQMLNEYTSLFVDTGANLSLTGTGREERLKYYSSLPIFLQRIRPVVFLYKRMLYACRMFCSKTPRQYSLYRPGVFDRVQKYIENPTCIWKTRKQWRRAAILPDA